MGLYGELRFSARRRATRCSRLDGVLSLFPNDEARACEQRRWPQTSALIIVFVCLSQILGGMVGNLQPNNPDARPCASAFLPLLLAASLPCRGRSVWSIPRWKPPDADFACDSAATKPPRHLSEQALPRGSRRRYSQAIRHRAECGGEQYECSAGAWTSWVFSPRGR